MSITITLQAPSDAVMTDNNLWFGTDLADDDLRKVYGLPNMYIDDTDTLKFAIYETYGPAALKPPRWDTVNAPSVTNNLETVIVLGSEIESGITDEQRENYDYWANVPDVVRYPAHIPPTTTAFQLRCDSISHDVDDATAISPLPSMNTNNGAKANSMTPGQLINIVIGMGMRSEVIKLTGMLVDEGPISASNPRKQVLMNIARLQYLKSGRGGSEDNWGGANSGPLNPRSYPCLTIYDPNTVLTDTFDRMDREPAGLDLSYRGIIKNLSFRQEGGRPNQWFWSMEFQVVANEHPQANSLSAGGTDGAMQISRIRLVDSADEETALDSGDFPTPGKIEIQVTRDLEIPYAHPNKGTVSRLRSWQTIKIVETNSVPPINGHWYITNLNYTNNTFLLSEAYNVGANPEWSDIEDAAGRDISIATGDNAMGQVRGRWDATLDPPDYTWEGFTNGTNGYVIFPPSGGSQSGMRFDDVVLKDVFAADGNDAGVP